MISESKLIFAFRGEYWFSLSKCSIYNTPELVSDM